MNEEELIETLRAFEKNRVEQLEEPARNLFYAIMKIADERDRLNNIIKEVREYIEKNKQKTIPAYGDNFDDDFDIALDEEDIDNILEILDKGE